MRSVLRYPDHKSLNYIGSSVNSGSHSMVSDNTNFKKTQKILLIWNFTIMSSVNMIFRTRFSFHGPLFQVSKIVLMEDSLYINTKLTVEQIINKIDDSSGVKQRCCKPCCLVQNITYILSSHISIRTYKCMESGLGSRKKWCRIWPTYSWLILTFDILYIQV